MFLKVTQFLTNFILLPFDAHFEIKSNPFSLKVNLLNQFKTSKIFEVIFTVTMKVHKNVIDYILSHFKVIGRGRFFFVRTRQGHTFQYHTGIVKVLMRKSKVTL